MKRLALVGAILALAAGCAGPEKARVAWSDQEAIARPEPRTPLREGRLVVRTPEKSAAADERDRTQKKFAGYAVFKADGSLVHSCRGHFATEDWIDLPPGRYIVVAHVNDGVFGTKAVKAQAIVAVGESTFVTLQGESPMAPGVER